VSVLCRLCSGEGFESGRVTSWRRDVKMSREKEVPKVGYALLLSHGDGLNAVISRAVTQCGTCVPELPVPY
jgi:hypothetical protein